MSDGANRDYASRRLRLRPTVAAVVDDEGGHSNVHVFWGNTRQSRSFAFRSDLASLLLALDGTRPAQDVAREVLARDHHELDLDGFLEKMCSERLVEDADVLAQWDNSPHRRLVNFLGDYFPSDELDDAMTTLHEAVVVIFGLGGVGSWVAHMLARSAIGTLVLVDPDVVEASNLNRSRFRTSSIGHSKAKALADDLAAIGLGCRIIPIVQLIATEADVDSVLQIAGTLGSSVVAVNCADQPSVDDTNRLIAPACSQMGYPLVIGGGYNLHLNLLGPTILPDQPPCLDCILDDLRHLPADRTPAELGRLERLERPRRKLGSLGPLAISIASFAANETLRCALRGRRIQPALIGRRAEYDVLKDRYAFADFHGRTDCPTCASARNTLNDS